jgi:hypothetical protein
MPGLFSRLIGIRSRRETAPLPFTLELPDGWAGGRPPHAYREALLDYGRAHPECHDRVMERLRYPAGVDALYAAAAACGPDARMSVGVAEVPRELPVEDALDAYVTGNMEDLASREDLLGEPTATSVDIPYGGRVLRWSWSYEGAAPSSLELYVFASGGRLWELTFFSSAASAVVNEATFLAIASSFRVTQPSAAL